MRFPDDYDEATISQCSSTGIESWIYEYISQSLVEFKNQQSKGDQTTESNDKENPIVLNQ